MEYHHFDCQCHYYEHCVRFTLDDEDGDVCVEVRMNHFLPWWKRLWVAVGYVLGFTGPHGHFGDTRLKSDDWARLHNLLDRAALIRTKNGLLGPQEKSVTTK